MVRNPPPFHKARSIAGDAYRRRARRVRHAHRHDLSAMHHALCDAARTHDRELSEERSSRAPQTNAAPSDIELHLPDHMLTSAGSARRFAANVSAAVEGGVLRYSARMGLLKEASRRGIRRFEANLIIAAVQHQMGSAGEEAVHRKRTFPVPPLMVALLVEAVVIAGVWLAL